MKYDQTLTENGHTLTVEAKQEGQRIEVSRSFDGEGLEPAYSNSQDGRTNPEEEAKEFLARLRIRAWADWKTEAPVVIPDGFVAVRIHDEYMTYWAVIPRTEINNANLLTDAYIEFGRTYDFGEADSVDITAELFETAAQINENNSAELIQDYLSKTADYN